MKKFRFTKAKFRNRSTTLNRSRDWKKDLYNKTRGRAIRLKWKDPKGGYRRKRYYSRNLKFA